MHKKSLRQRLNQFILPCGLFSLLITVVLVGCNQPQNRDENKTGAQEALSSLNTKDAGNTITVVNWNIEWLGSNSNGPKDKARQLQNACKILPYLNADIYCLCEIVDPVTLEKLTASLGPHYTYRLSEYSSGARRSTDHAYSNGQKLAYIYNTQRIKNVTTSAYLSHNPKAGYYFASGRYPFRMEATVHTAEVDQKVDFMIIHAKSGAALSSYDRRLQAARILKTALDKDKTNRPVMLLGDFNDHVVGSITQGKASPYQNFVQDPDYHVLTLDLADQRSTLDYPGVIDQQVISKAFNKFYKAGSTFIRTDIKTVVPDFNKGTTSDHYPVSSVFIFSKARAIRPALRHPAEKSTTGSLETPQSIQPPIFTAAIKTGSIMVHARKKSRHIQFIVYNKRQHKVLSVRRKYILQGDSFQIRTPKLYKGDYTLVIFSDHGEQVLPFTVQ